MRYQRKILLLMLALLLAACGAEDVEEGVHLYPAAIEMRDAPDMDNRYSFEVTGPEWDTPHIEIGDEIWRGVGAPFDLDGRLEGVGLDEPAPYLRATPVNLGTSFHWSGQVKTPPDAIRVEATGTLTSTTDADLEPRALFEASQLLEGSTEIESSNILEFGGFEVLTDELPERVDLWELEIAWQLTPLADGEPIEDATELLTVHRIPTSWRKPTSDVTLYRETVLWSSKWAAGLYADTEEAAQESEHEISLALLKGMQTLGDYGYEYGTFRRPPKDEIVDRANVFLDFKRSACGEFRGMLMNLIEYHGIDTRWIWWRKSHDDDHKLGVYKTRKLPAVGRSAKHWYNTNHIVVTVNGRVYDPTYTVYKESFETYEDWMFQKYCRGASDHCGGACWLDDDDERRDCVDNPAGLDQDDFEIIRGSSYR